MAENKSERYLIDLKRSCREAKPNFWFLDDSEHGLEGAAIALAEPAGASSDRR